MSIRLQLLLPLKQLVRKAEMGLYDDIQTTSSHEAVGAGEGEAGRAHHFGDADCC